MATRFCAGDSARKACTECELLSGTAFRRGGTRAVVFSLTVNKREVDEYGQPPLGATSISVLAFIELDQRLVERLTVSVWGSTQGGRLSHPTLVISSTGFDSSWSMCLRTKQGQTQPSAAVLQYGLFTASDAEHFELSNLFPRDVDNLQRFRHQSTPRNEINMTLTLLVWPVVLYTLSI